MPAPSPSKHNTQTVSTNMAPPHSTVGHFSFGPATQQTVVTTTTTTTISFPPLQIKPPQDLYERDPKQYPLAFTPTPHAIKKFGFDIGETRTTYREADDADASLRNVSKPPLNDTYIHPVWNHNPKHYGGIANGTIL